MLSEETSLRHVCITVPCFNPPGEWELRLLERYRELVRSCGDLPVSFSITITNDGSTRNFDQSKLSSLIPDATIVSYPENRGKGYALRQGVTASTADFFVMTDVDFPYTTESMRRVVVQLLKTGGVAAGNRDGSYYDRVPFVRKVISRSLRWMLRFVLRLSVTDSQCGLKGFDQAGRVVFLETTIDRFLFDLEFLMQAHKRVAVHPVSVELRSGIVFSKMGWGILRVEGLNFIRLFLSKHIGRR